MPELEQFGTGGVHDRQLGLLHLASFSETSNLGQFSGTHFACLVACDATNVTYSSLASFAFELLSRGAVYICAWGPGCEQVHDVFDDEIVGSGPDFPQFPLSVVTTWHDSEPLDEAIYWFLRHTHPSDEFSDSCRTAVAITVGETSWRTRVREALLNPTALYDAVLEYEESAQQVASTDPSSSPGN